MILFDLDGTVVNSSHRYHANEEGTVDLNHWRANCTPSQIAKDLELPLAAYWRQMRKRGVSIVVCTARVMTSADHTWLVRRGLIADLILSREGIQDIRSGVVQKLEQLRRFAPLWRSVTFFEDNVEIRHAIKKAYAFNCIDPMEVNL